MRRGQAKLFGVVGGFVEASPRCVPLSLPSPRRGEGVMAPSAFEADCSRLRGLAGDCFQPRACSCNHCAAPRPAIMPLAKQAVSR